MKKERKVWIVLLISYYIHRIWYIKERKEKNVAEKLFVHMFPPNRFSRLVKETFYDSLFDRIWKTFPFAFISGIDSGVDSTLSSNISSEIFLGVESIFFPFIHSNFIFFVCSIMTCSVYSYTSAFVSYLIDNNSNKMIVMMIIISLLTFCLCWWLTTGPISSNRTTSKELTIHCCYGTFRFLNVWAIFLYGNRNEKRKEKGRKIKIECYVIKLFYCFYSYSFFLF